MVVDGVPGQLKILIGADMSVKIGDIVEVKESWTKGIAFQVISQDSYPDKLICVMVGDNRPFSFYEEDLESLDEDRYCSSCGQIGCGWH